MKEKCLAVYRQTWVNTAVAVLTNTTPWFSLANGKATNRFQILIIVNQARIQNNSNVFDEGMLKKIQKMLYYPSVLGLRLQRNTKVCL